MTLKAILAEEFIHAATTFREENAIRTGFGRLPVSQEALKNFPQEYPSQRGRQSIFIAKPDEAVPVEKIMIRDIYETEASLSREKRVQIKRDAMLTENLTHLALHYLLPLVQPSLKKEYDSILLLADDGTCIPLPLGDQRIADIIYHALRTGLQTELPSIFPDEMISLLQRSELVVASTNTWVINGGNISTEDLARKEREDIFFYPPVHMR